MGGWVGEVVLWAKVLIYQFINRSISIAKSWMGGWRLGSCLCGHEFVHWGVGFVLACWC